MDASSNAASLGVAKGDVILGVNNKETKSVDALQNALSPTASGWSITIARGGMAIQLSVGP